MSFQNTGKAQIPQISSRHLGLVERVNDKIFSSLRLRTQPDKQRYLFCANARKQGDLRNNIAQYKYATRFSDNSFTET